jgi:hypothetical protein
MSFRSLVQRRENLDEMRQYESYALAFVQRAGLLLKMYF